MKLNRLIAWAIYDARLMQDMTQQELAAKAGVHRTTISKAENGELHNLGTVEAILDALGINDFAQIIKSADTEPKEDPVDKLHDEAQKTRQTGAQSLTGASERTYCEDPAHPFADDVMMGDYHGKR